MLNTVPSRINQASRLVVLRHPNSMDCVMFRKVLLRKDDPDTYEGGEPTLGGMGVLDSTDEDDFDWDHIGTGRILFTGQYEPGAVVDRDGALAQQPSAVALVEFTEMTTADGEVPVTPALDPSLVPELHRHDVIYALIGQDVHLTYEVVSIEGTLHVPPYTRRYVLNARDELSYQNVTV